MAKQSLVWTALPNGYTADKKGVRVSVLVSPRLDPEGPDTTLARFTHFVKWPDTVAKSKFTVRFGASPVKIAGNDTASESRVDTTLGAADSAAWTALLPPETIIRGFNLPKPFGKIVVSYPAAKIDTLIHGLYSSLANSATDDLPKVSQVLRDAEWKKVIGAVGSNDRRFLHEKDRIRDVPAQFKQFRKDRFKGLGSPAAELALLQLFHTPPSTPLIGKHDPASPNPKPFAKWLAFKQTPLPTEDELAKSFDFHQIVAAMAQFPTLLRKLGLVIDLVVAKAKFPNAADQPLSVTVELPEPPPMTEEGLPAAPGPSAAMETRTLLDAARFLPVPRKGTPSSGDYKASDGLVLLDPKRFKLLQMDGDGAGLKVVNFARTLARLDGNKERQRHPVTKIEDEDGAPALRNAGLMLVHIDRGALLEKTLNRQEALNIAIEKLHAGQLVKAMPPLYAEDIVRGYRIDIWNDKTRRWHSLCQRIGHYDIHEGEHVFDAKDEEGALRLGATKSADETSNPDLLWLHEALVSWTGWSLCARAPGRTIHHREKNEATGEADHQDFVGDAEAHIPAGMRLKTLFTPQPGSLPRLRYGRGYWIRARVVDLAANSLPPNPKDFGPEAPLKNKVRFLRYEPIPPPALALVKPVAAAKPAAPGPGESMERIAVRTFNDVPAKNKVTTSESAQRFGVPARANQKEAELHGMLDRAGRVDGAKFAMLALKDNSFGKVAFDLAGPMGTPVATKFTVCEEDQKLPYLPEPLAAVIGARVLGHPDFPANTVISIPLYDPKKDPGKEWPDALPFKIRLYEGPIAPAPPEVPRFDDETRTLLIPLPKAIRATLRLSVRPSDEALGVMAAWPWLTSVDQKRRAKNGQHWMLTPWRNVELVHAVQKPLITPAIFKLDILPRAKNCTFASPNFHASCSIKSTDHLDLRAEWNEPLEDVSQPAGANRTRTDHAFAVQIIDAKRYGPDEKLDYLLMGTDIVRAGGIFHDKVTAKHHEFNDTRYRRIEYWLEATTAFREFMPTEVLTNPVLTDGETTNVPTDERIKVVGEKAQGWIPNSASPPAPQVLYVVPTFGWVRTTAPGTQSSLRRGGGLRVYLDRPWNVTGYGEMLAVVLPRAKFIGDPNISPSHQPLKPFVSQWGNDPVWLSPGLAGPAPKKASFPLARTKRDLTGQWLPDFVPPAVRTEEAKQPPADFATDELWHPELIGTSADSRVDIAPHDVFYDAERQLWYCDIEIEWGASYFPFVRLALARYQPVSVPEAHLSNIVLADFMPLVPDRWLSVTATNDPKKRQVSVFGSTYSATGGQTVNPKIAKTSIVEVSVERLDPRLGEDFGWKRESGAVITPDADFKQAAPKNAPPAARLARAKKLRAEGDYSALLQEGLLDLVLAAPMLWKGSVTLPPAPGGTARYRLVIAEIEEYPADDADPYDKANENKAERIVFIEHVELG